MLGPIVQASRRGCRSTRPTASTARAATSSRTRRVGIRRSCSASCDHSCCLALRFCASCCVPLRPIFYRIKSAWLSPYFCGRAAHNSSSGGAGIGLIAARGIRARGSSVAVLLKRITAVVTIRISRLASSQASAMPPASSPPFRISLADPALFAISLPELHSVDGSGRLRRSQIVSAVSVTRLQRTALGLICLVIDCHADSRVSWCGSAGM
jgi:hypothetical protein